MLGSNAFFSTRALVVAASIAVLGAGAPVFAAPINYGDFTGSTVMYLDVTETANTPGDTEPLYGAPSIIGDTLDFDPRGFSASSTNGISDITDGQLNLTLMSSLGNAVSSITLSESGDYSLLGAGTAATRIAFGVSFGSVKVLEVDGQALATPVALSGASASGGDDLSNGSDVLTPWSLSLSYDVGAALAAAGVPFRSGATKLEIAVDDMLAAISEPTSIAYIAKKDFVLEAQTIGVSSSVLDVPEPGSLALLGLGLAALRVLGCRRAQA